MSWDEEFSQRYDEWSSATTAEVPFYVNLAQESEGPIDGAHKDNPVPHVNRYDVTDNRIDIVLDSGAVSSLRWATKNEWLGLIDIAGLEVEAVYGDFDETPLSADSREYIFVTTRR